MPILCEVFRDLALESEELDSVAWYRKFNPSHASPTLSVGSWEGILGEITKHDYSPSPGLCELYLCPSYVKFAETSRWRVKNSTVLHGVANLKLSSIEKVIWLS